MFRKLLLVIGVIVSANMLVFSQSGTLKGKISNIDTKDPVPFANIIIETGGKQYGGTTSDFDGNYTIKPIPPGKYTVKASYVGHNTKVVNNVVINANKITFLDLKLKETQQTLDVVEVTDYKVPLISKDKTSSGETVTSEEIAKIPGRSASAVAVTVGGVFSRDGEMGSIRGSRTDGTVTYIDGVRVRGSSNLPKAAMEEISVITGGTPAKFGEATGGILNIITKGPSREFGASIEYVTSELFDQYGYNLGEFSLYGPLIKSKDPNKSTSLLGFFISGSFSHVKDGDPSAIGIYKVKDEKLEELELEPLRPSGTGFGSYQNSAFIRESDLEKVKAKLNRAQTGINLSGKIDVRTTDYTNLTFGGQFNYTEGNSWSLANSLLNYKNNNAYETNTWRVYGKFTQRFPSDPQSKSLIKNVFYQIQVDFSKYSQTLEDERHRDNLFNYGHVGKYTTYKIPFYEPGSDTVNGIPYNNVWLLTNFFDTLITFQPSELNPVLSNYTQQYYSRYNLYSGAYINSTQIQENGALLNGQLPDNVYSMYNNTGAPYNGWSHYEQEQYGLNASGSADIGNHALEFGFQYEQLSTRSIGYAPYGLWTLMRSLTNYHIRELDIDNPDAVYDASGVFQDTIKYDRKYDAESQRFFDYNLRLKLGLPVNGTDWIDVDNLDPSTFSIDMFSADELFNQGFRTTYVSYYGYDHTGEKLSSKPSFDDFFTARDDFGNYLRPIGAFEPIYMAGYIQDVFAFKDLIFNVGLRIDRFDANQMVLKDPWLLYEAKTVEEVPASEFGLDAHPGNMGSEYVVYVDDIHDPTAILGYRNEATWYNALGNEIEDPSLLTSGTTTGRITPYLIDPNQDNISSNAFEDYEPQTTAMPRVAFSFPISDEALFFAHYDVITKRPTTGLRLDPTDYLFIGNSGTNLIANPNLKPEKTVDYELGFQQKLSPTSAMQISAYYREMRDNIQVYRFTEAYPNSYYSFNNLDFGTVKGLIISYDLRRTNNVRLRASYTLQFAEGTGSNAESQSQLVTSGFPNLRILNPLDYDQRHAIKTSVDYRYASGKNYNGPVINRRIKGTDKVKSILVFENAGANVTFNGGSGTPYSRNSKYGFLNQQTRELQGSINGSRLPWQFWIDAGIDKNFMLKFGKGEEKKKVTYLNVYLQILNVLNTKNVVAVYTTTGNPDDDGYLSAAEFQQSIESHVDSQSFRELYAIRINNPSNYSAPRRIRLGLILNF
ncbi:TonB-dependent receptor domain-containing protein [candidate division KSB1 bacterium]